MSSRGGSSRTPSDELQFLPYGADEAPYSIGCVDVMMPQCDNGDPGPFLRLYYPRDKRTMSMASGPVVSVYKRDYIRWLPRGEYVDAWLAQSTCPLARLFMKKRVADRVRRWNIKVRWHAKLACGPSGERWHTALISPAKHMPRFAYSVLATEWASQGVIVAVLEHGSGACSWTYRLVQQHAAATAGERGGERLVHINHRRAPGGACNSEAARAHERHVTQFGAGEIERALELLAAIDRGDRATLDQFVTGGDYATWHEWAGRLDVANTVLVGHALGGASVLSAIANRYCAVAKAIVLDGTMYILDGRQYATLRDAPTRILFVNADKVHKDEVNYRYWLCRKDPDRKKMLTIRGCQSSHFTDASYVPLGCVNSPSAGIGALPTALLHEIVTELMLEFRLNGDKSDWLGASKVRLRGRYANHIAVPAPAAVERRLNANFTP